jgi:hypothetical protein
MVSRLRDVANADLAFEIKKSIGWIGIGANADGNHPCCGLCLLPWRGQQPSQVLQIALSSGRRAFAIAERRLHDLAIL